MRITQVKCKEGTTVEGVTMNVNTPEPFQLTNCPDRRSEEFESARLAVQADAFGIVGLGSRLADRYVLTGVACNEDKNGNRSFVFTGKLRTNAGEVALNTPTMRAPGGVADGGTVLTASQVETVDTFLARALDYRNGEREQLELPVGAGAGTGDGEDAEGSQD